jgi:hypothetical protein
MASTALLELAESTLYVSTLLSDQPRAIDRIIDYFGERRPTTTKGRPGTTARIFSPPYPSAGVGGSSPSRRFRLVEASGAL